MHLWPRGCGWAWVSDCSRAWDIVEGRAPAGLCAPCVLHADVHVCVVVHTHICASVQSSVSVHTPQCICTTVGLQQISLAPLSPSLSPPSPSLPLPQAWLSASFLLLGPAAGYPDSWAGGRGEWKLITLCSLEDPLILLAPLNPRPLVDATPACSQLVWRPHGQELMVSPASTHQVH